MASTLVTLLLVLVIIFLIILAVPVIYMFFLKKETKEIIEFEFPPSLFDKDLTDLKWESVQEGSTDIISTISLRDRGSVRIAHGRVLTKEAMEERKAAAFSVELP